MRSAASDRRAWTSSPTASPSISNQSKRTVLPGWPSCGQATRAYPVISTGSALFNGTLWKRRVASA